jgi:hypothetical protein
MFTMMGIGLVVLMAFVSNREQSKDTGSTDDYIRYTRQDTRMVFLAARGGGSHARHHRRPHPLDRDL